MIVGRGHFGTEGLLARATEGLTWLHGRVPSPRKGCLFETDFARKGCLFETDFGKSKVLTFVD